jgi:hypothetical protein
MRNLFYEHVAAGSGFHPSMDSFEQLHTDLPFHLLNLTADPGLSRSEALGGQRDLTRLSYRQHHPQETIHVNSFYISHMKAV